MQSRIETVQAGNFPYLVVEQDGQVQGYAYATQWKERSAYRFCVESTIYLADEAQGKGLGTLLYSRLIDKIREQKFTNIIGVITLPNSPSVTLHENMGMVKVAHFPKVGFKFNQWHDVGYWQLSIR